MEKPVQKLIQKIHAEIHIKKKKDIKIPCCMIQNVVKSCLNCMKNELKCERSE